MDAFDEILEECRRTIEQIFPDRPDDWESLITHMVAPAVLGYLSVFSKEARVLYNRYQQYALSSAAESGFQLPEGTPAADYINAKIRAMQSRAFEHSRILKDTDDADA